MANTFVVSRAQMIYAFCLPLAVLLGYLLADPMDRGNLAVVVLIGSVLAVPVLMRWYHPLLIFTWNAAITPWVLPGQPSLWMLIAMVGLGFGVINRLTTPEAKFVWVPSLNWSLLALTLVILITAALSGGMGSRLLGSERYGGKAYIYCFASLAGYFALSSQRVPPERATLYVALFFLSGMTALIPNLAYLGGSALQFLFYIFPPGMAQEQAFGDYYLFAQFSRIYGLMYVASALWCFLLARYGLRGTLDPTKPVRLALFLVAFGSCLFCGFRAAMVTFLAVFAIQFVLDGLCRPRVVAGLLAALVVAMGLILPNATKLPLVVQRTLSFLPIEISPIARQSAEDSSEWRLRMWQQTLPEVPQYLLKGKGYAIDPTALDFAFENAARGYGNQYEWAVVGGVYHNGPLSVVIPFGIWGVAAFGWFVFAAIKYLYRAYRQGDPALRHANTLLFGLFIAKLAVFLFVYGSFFNDLFLFTGVAGLSVSLNGTLEEAPAAESLPESEEPPFPEQFVPEELA
jgi:hypothetical protein